jgi:hypothetical protein
MRRVLHFVSIFMFIIGICGADSQNLIYPIALTLGGFIIAYITRGDYYDID